MRVPFNRPFLAGRELRYIREAIESGQISGNGRFTRLCQEFFERRYGFRKSLLTTSGTAALEMAALLLDVGPADEIILPSYTFVSTANAFALRGAELRFVDSESTSPNLDVGRVEELITPRTKAVVVVHYAGVACDMDPILDLAKRHGLFVVEDAAQAVDSSYRDRPLGSIGDLAAFSFHETKNVIAGEGGMLVINNDRFAERSEVIWEKGTNRTAFARGEVSKYEWVDIGSSFLPSEVTAAFLYAQLEELDSIQARRSAIWGRYHDGLAAQGGVTEFLLPHLPDYATNNAHMFYLVFRSLEDRIAVQTRLRERGILAVFHYLPLHRSPFFEQRHDGRALPMADRYADCLLRLPFYLGLQESEVDEIVTLVTEWAIGSDRSKTVL